MVYEPHGRNHRDIPWEGIELMDIPWVVPWDDMVIMGRPLGRSVGWSMSHHASHHGLSHEPPTHGPSRGTVYDPWDTK